MTTRRPLLWEAQPPKHGGHAALRAAHLRWKLEAGSWDLKYEPGKDLVADIGAKVLAPTRVQNLMRNMEMDGNQKGETGKKMNQKKIFLL